MFDVDDVLDCLSVPSLWAAWWGVPLVVGADMVQLLMDYSCKVRLQRQENGRWHR